MLSDMSDLIDRTDGMLLGIRNNGRNDRTIFLIEEKINLLVIT